MLTALIVDDRLENIEFLQHLLTAHNLRSISTISGKEAFVLAQKQLPNIIFMDLGMPERTWNGFETTRNLKSHHLTCDIPVVALTGGGSEQDAQQAGCDGFLARPFTIIQLRLELTKHLGVNFK